MVSFDINKYKQLFEFIFILFINRLMCVIRSRSTAPRTRTFQKLTS